MNKKKREDDLFNSLQRTSTLDYLFGIDSGRGILGDMLADRELAHDIASGMNVRDALAKQRFMDDLFGDGHNHGIISDMISDGIVADEFENGRDLGDTLSEQRFWDDLFD